MSPSGVGIGARSAPVGRQSRAKVRSNSALKSNFQRASSTITKTMDSTVATEMAWIPVANPMPMEPKMYTASPDSLRLLRNRTAATMPARLNARARLSRTTTRMAVTTIGSMITVCTSEWSNLIRLRVRT